MKYVAEALVDETKEEMIYFWQPKPEDYEYKRPVAERGTIWGDLVVLEIKLLWGIRRGLDSMGAGMFLRQCISNNPYRLKHRKHQPTRTIMVFRRRRIRAE